MADKDQEQSRDAQENEDNLKQEGQYNEDASRFESSEKSTEKTTPTEKPEKGSGKEGESKEEFKVDPEEWDRTRRALTKANEEAKNRRLKLQEWDELGVDPETVKAWKQERDEEELRKAEEEGRYQEIIEKTRNEATSKVSQAQQERDAMKAQLESYLVDKNLTEAIAAEEGIPKLLQGIAKQYVKTVQDESGAYRTVVVDDDGMPRKNDAGNDMDVRELVQSFKTDPDLAYAFKAPKVSGNGSDSQASNTPPSKKPGPKPHRGKMSQKEQRDFVRQHGYAEFRKLPR